MMQQEQFIEHEGFWSSYTNIRKAFERATPGQKSLITYDGKWLFLKDIHLVTNIV